MTYSKQMLWFYFMVLMGGCLSAPKPTIVTPKEQHRPHFHFTPPAHWMNDPNGMVYYEGEYHLFYQYFPEGTVWGPMHWGHAVSNDMVQWQHLPIALYPDSLGLIFSGSAVVDWKNSSGLGKNGKPPLVAIFTQHLMEGEKSGRHDFQYQSIAYSNDKGRTWTTYAGNPVIPNVDNIHDFRDPKVIWDEARQQWLMVFAAHDKVMFWASKNLKNWTYLSDFGQNFGAHGGVWECPDFFPMPVEASQGQSKSSLQKWVLLQSLNPGAANGGSGTQYFIGDFDGKTFTLDPNFAQSVTNGKGVWLDWGRDNYAGVTWSDVPPSDGRRLFMGWMSNWDYAQAVPTQNWRSAMTLPRQLVLKETPAGYRLFSLPVKELNTLRKKVFHIDNQAINGKLDLTSLYRLSQPTLEMDLTVEFPENATTDFAVVLSNNKGEEYRIGFDAAKNEFYSDRTKAGKSSFSDKFAAQRHAAPRFQTGNIVHFHLFLDVASGELFADGGSVAMTDIFFPTTDFDQVTIVAENGTARLINGKIWKLD